MFNFYPGPSKLAANMAQYCLEAVDDGILERNHRSEPFRQLYQETLVQFQQKLQLPTDYKLLFISSATEAWEVIAQSLTNNKSGHFFNGAFGNKWFSYAQKLHKADSHTFSINQLPDLTNLTVAPDLLAFTQNETSNGTQLPDEFMEEIGKVHKESLIAYDVTSSLGGINLNWALGDVWFASVQKCFGLPSGLGLLILSPRAIERAEVLQDNKHYNSVLPMLNNAEKWQTHYTPNILNIYLLKRVLEERPSIEALSNALVERAEKLYTEIESFRHFNLLVSNKAVRSNTVLCIEAKPEIVEQVKRAAMNKAILFGNGYGELKHSTFRIANFPAIKEQDFDVLMRFLKDFDARF